MSSINYAILLGGLTRDPELRHAGTGGSICKFSVARPSILEQGFSTRLHTRRRRRS